MSDGSSSEVSDTTWNANRGGGNWAPVPAEANVIYKVRFRSETPDATLKVTWKLVDEPNQFRSHLRLQGATLRAVK